MYRTSLRWPVVAIILLGLLCAAGCEEQVNAIPED